ncbi:hypothetical protein DFH08DRAFT_961944 [Mycena albidolilacea]|uniref:Uncharacterized protein n=1 Tax=Mycena albidolilacea TaxID=1033008 RepID=A0AAD6ZXX0_9AGAR|nr:hypothetical protein DFH08DRAFT_961944 [Mycena albidolilacea]
MVEFNSHPRTSDVNQFYTPLAGCHRSHSSLLSIHLDFTAELRPTIRENKNSYVIASATLRILFCFEILTDVNIQSVAFDLDDATVLEMARSWPQLRKLQLIAFVPITQLRTTLQSLLSIARHCTHLNSLHMTFDASAIPALESNVAHISQTSLAFIHVAYSPILTPLPVARFISGIFPSLTSISTAHDDGDDEDDEQELARQMIFHARWKEVGSHIPMILAIREEGRAWAQSSS